MRDQPALVKPKYACDYDAHAAYWLTKLSLSIDKYLRQITRGVFAEEVRELIGVSSPTKRSSRKALRSQLRTYP